MTGGSLKFKEISTPSTEVTASPKLACQEDIVFRGRVGKGGAQSQSIVIPRLKGMWHEPGIVLVRQYHATWETLCANP